MTTYGEMLREWRTARNVSQRDLAELVSCDHTYLSKIESGALPAPSDDLSRKLAMALSINPDLLINLSAKPPQDWGDTLASNPRGVQVLRLLTLCRFSDDTYEAMRQAMLSDLGYDPFIPDRTGRTSGERLPGDPFTSNANKGWFDTLKRGILRKQAVQGERRGDAGKSRMGVCVCVTFVRARVNATQTRESDKVRMMADDLSRYVASLTPEEQRVIGALILIDENYADEETPCPHGIPLSEPCDTCIRVFVTGEEGSASDGH